MKEEYDKVALIVEFEKVFLNLKLGFLQYLFAESTTALLIHFDNLSFFCVYFVLLIRICRLLMPLQINYSEKEPSYEQCVGSEKIFFGFGSDFTGNSGSGSYFQGNAKVGSQVYH